ncbi:MAG: universal stress protein [Phreatobacter sp.]|uniref:universal stress protein n=1 Tax=Phreatobacter sp. TaxID=1966341 RepID=UPI0027371CDF|nr:universal stress protein [Phreatobacter sp.]MDP2800795.1 universal stress protein [Phreatobacter sp.]
MAFKDLLFPLNSYPEATPVAAIEGAVGIAAALDASIAALAVHIELPHVGNVLAKSLLDLPGMIAAEREKSEAGAKATIAVFEAAASRRGVAHDHVVESCPSSQLATLVTELARMRDMTVIPVGEESGLQHHVVESVIFGSGRPTLVFPAAAAAVTPAAFDAVGIAWDFSRPAARAVADALPILARARTVRIVTVTREKTIPTHRSAAELARHLARHGITAILDEEDAAGRPIGQALGDYAATHGLGLLVMGAYGHSRLRDFILGGATKTIVSQPPLPVLLSH